MCVVHVRGHEWYRYGWLRRCRAGLVSEVVAFIALVRDCSAEGDAGCGPRLHLEHMCA